MNPDSPSPVTRAQRRRRDTITRVLDAATNLFASNGFTETSMASIAAEADVSVGTLYNLFDSKDELYRELIHGKAARFGSRLHAVITADGSPRQNLDRFLQEQLALFVDEALFIRLFYRVNADARFSLRASLPDDSRSIYEDTLSQLAELLERGVAAGEFQLRADPYRAAVCCQAVVTELFLLHTDDPQRHPAGAVLEEATRFVHRNVLAEHARRGTGEATREQSK